MAGLGSTYPPRSARPPSPNLEPNELKIGDKPGVEILVVTDGGCGSNKLTDLGARCGSILRLDRGKGRAWLCQGYGEGVCVGLNRLGLHNGDSCDLDLKSNSLGTCIERDFGKDRKVSNWHHGVEVRMGDKLSEAVRNVLMSPKFVLGGRDSTQHGTYYWDVDKRTFSPKKPGWGYEKVEEGLEHQWAKAQRKAEEEAEEEAKAQRESEAEEREQRGDDVTKGPNSTNWARRVGGHEYSQVGPSQAPQVGPSGQIGGRKPRGRKRRTRRTRGRRRRGTYKRKRRVRRRGTRRR